MLFYIVIGRSPNTVELCTHFRQARVDTSLAWPDRFFSARRLSVKIISACSKKALIILIDKRRILIDKRRAEKKRSGHARLRGHDKIR